VRILAAGDPELTARLAEFQDDLAAVATAKDIALQQRLAE
jgi:hypothetical protein